MQTIFVLNCYIDKREKLIIRKDQTRNPEKNVTKYFQINRIVSHNTT